MPEDDALYEAPSALEPTNGTAPRRRVRRAPEAFPSSNGPAVRFPDPPRYNPFDPPPAPRGTVPPNQVDLFSGEPDRPPRKSEHVFDQVADELADWLTQTEDWLVSALEYRGRAPGAAVLTERQKYDYWARRWWNPDGTPNQAARDQIMEQRGPRVFAQIALYMEHKDPNARTLGPTPTQPSAPEQPYDDGHEPEAPY